jgi:hypothetical protein
MPQTSLLVCSVTQQTLAIMTGHGLRRVFIEPQNLICHYQDHSRILSRVNHNSINHGPKKPPQYIPSLQGRHSATHDMARLSVGFVLCRDGSIEDVMSTSKRGNKRRNRSPAPRRRTRLILRLHQQSNIFHARSKVEGTAGFRSAKTDLAVDGNVLAEEDFDLDGFQDQ